MNEPSTTQLYLDSPEVTGQLDQVCEQIVISDDIGEAKRFLEMLTAIFSAQPDFQKINPTAFSSYHGYLVAVNYVILYELADKDIFQLLRDEFGFVLKYPDYDLNRKIRYKITSILELEARDVFKNKIREILLKCDYVLGKGRIMVNDISQAPTIANWLKDYYIKVGIEKADPLKVNQYFINSNNIKLLSEADRAQIKKIFNFFENLKVSSVEFPTYEESFGAVMPDGELIIATNGRFEKIGTDIIKNYKQAVAIRSGQTVINEQPSSSSSPLSSSPLPSSSLMSSLVNPPKPITPATPAAPTVLVQPAAPANPLLELEQALSSYPPDSLEHKAIKQEINRLKVAAFKQAQKTNVKK